MKPLLVFTIPGNPGLGAINKMWRSRVVGRSARVYKTKEGTAFAALARRRAAAAVTSFFDRVAAGLPARPDAPSEVNVTIRCYWPRRRKLAGTTDLPMGDVDAPIKAVLDSLESAGILDDDSRVRSVTCTKYIDKADPRIEVEVWPVETETKP